MMQLIDALAEPFHVFNWVGVLEGGVNFATCVFIIGGIFIIYTAVKEISHMLTIEHLDTDVSGKPGKTAAQVVMMIVTVNLIFSFDSVLSALAITDVFIVLATAIILSGCRHAGAGRWCHPVSGKEPDVRGAGPLHPVDCGGRSVGRGRTGGGPCDA